MDGFIDLALRTRSDLYRAEDVPAHALVQVLEEMVVLGRELDQIKKALFYGKPLDQDLLRGITQRHNAGRAHLAGVDEAAQERLEGAEPDLVHSVVGILTEATEIAEELLHHLGGVDLDKEHLVEEVGDLMRYQALGLRALRSTFGAAAGRVIGKLRRRYPERFTSELAAARLDMS